MKNKRFTSLFLASMVALQLATPLSARQVEPTTEEDTHLNVVTEESLTLSHLTFHETYDEVQGTVSLTLEDYFELVSIEGTDYLLAKADYQSPTSEDFIFGGWYYEEHGTEQELDLGSTIVTSSTTITGKWISSELNPFAVDSAAQWKQSRSTTHTVSFYANADDTSALYVQTPSDGGTVTEPTIDPTKTGYTFDNWYYSSNNGTETIFNFSTPIYSDLSIYAKWIINKYTVSFKLYDGATDSLAPDQEIAYNNTVSAFNTDPTRSGYDFVSWKYKQDTTEKGAFVFGENGTKVTADITVYATWVESGIKSISIKEGTFSYAVGATLKTDDLVITVTYDDDSTVDMPYNTSDFTLSLASGTVLSSLHDKESFTVSYGSKSASRDLSVTYPTGTSTYTVAFDLDGGNINGVTEIKSRTMADGYTIETYGTPTKEDYVFTGWSYKDTSGNEHSFTFADSSLGHAGTTVSSAISTIYATWLSTTDVASIKITTNPQTEYTVEDYFDPTNLAIEMTPMSGSDYTKTILYSDAPDAFTFVPNLETQLQLSDTKVTVYYGGASAELPITVSKKQFTVTFNTKYGELNGSSKDTYVTVEDGSFEVKDPGDPVRDGYVFAGWYYEQSDGTEAKFGFQTTAITSDITIYAKWTESENPLIKVEFITNSITVFIEGETFDPTGLVMKLYYENGDETELLYGTSNADCFSFTPSLDTPLTIEDTKVTFTYADFDVVYTIPITVNEDDRWVSGVVRDYYDDLVNGALISFRQNNTEVYSTSTDASGVYSLQNLAAGTYTVVATYGNRTTSTIVTLTGNSQTLNTIYLPQAQSTTSILATSLVPFVQINNIDEVAAELSTGESVDTIVKIELELTNNYPSSDAEYMEAYKGTNEILGAFFDLSLYKSLEFSADSNTGKMPVSEISTLMEVVLDLPTELQGKGTYYVYRMHNGTMERLSATANDNGEKINLNSSKDQIVITTRKFSTYAIAYKEVADNGDDNYYDGYVGSDRYTISTNKIVNGVATKEDIGGSIYLSALYPIHNTKVTVSLTPYLGYVVDYVTASDAYGNNVSVYLEEDSIYTFNQGGSEITLNVAFRNIPIPTSPDGYTGFYDVNEGDWFYLTVLTAANLELMVGKGYGIFEPNATTTRAEIVQVLYNLAGSPQVSTISTFSDVLGYEWYYHAVNWAQSIGLVEGYGDTTFRPNQAISREELSSLFYAYAQTDPSITPILWPFAVEYSDHESISPWALDSVRWCTNKGLFSGKTGNFFGPQDAATRAEVAHCLLAITDRSVL